MSKRKGQQELESYSAEIVLNELQIKEAVAQVLAERGYIVTCVELEYDKDGETTDARCYAELPKSVISQPKVQD